MKTIIIALGIISFSMAAHAQSGDWSLELRSDRVALKVILQRLSNDSLFVSRDGAGEGIPLDSIMEMRKTRWTYTWPGAVAGTIGGALAGPAIAGVSNGEYAALTDFFFGALGGLIGGTVGAIAGGALSPNDVYDMRGMSHDEKRAAVEYILLHD